MKPKAPDIGALGRVSEYFQKCRFGPLRRRLLAAVQVQDVFDYPVHSQKVVLNNLRQTSIDAFQFLGLWR